MGLFGGGNSSSKTDYTTNNIDESLNAADSNVSLMEAGAIAAENVGKSVGGNNVETVAASGGSTVNQFSQEAASVVNNAIDSLSQAVSGVTAGGGGALLPSFGTDKAPAAAAVVKDNAPLLLGVGLIILLALKGRG